MTDEEIDDLDDDPQPLTQLALIGEILMILGSRFGIDALESRQMNALIRGVNQFMDEMANPPVPLQRRPVLRLLRHRAAPPGCGWTVWRDSDETGMSSLYIAHVGGLRRQPTEHAYPHDAGDFGRCVGLLDACPELRGSLPDVAAVGGPVWAGLVAEWASLERLWRAGDTNRLYEQMREIEQAAQA